MRTERVKIGMRLLVWSLWVAMCMGAPTQAATKNDEIKARWWKGNLHTHTLWSDGNDFPEMVVDWYKSHGYHFLALSDHNILLEGEKWIASTNSKARADTFKAYETRFGKRWVKRRVTNNVEQVRLRGLEEFKLLFEKRNRFILIPSEELTDHFNKLPIHLNASNIREFIPPQGGTNVLDVMQRNVNAVLDQRARTGVPMIPHLNHPNFGWAITAEDLMRVQGERFFEVYNGHPLVHNDGTNLRPGTERIWDIVLSWRLGELGMEPMFGLAVDDSHHYHANSPTNANPGRGWIMVRSMRLTPEGIIAAMEAGDFYASTGVVLKDIQTTNNQLTVAIEAEPGVDYTTLFLGTRSGFDRKTVPVEGKGTPITREYSDELGEILAEVEGAEATYEFDGDELYVRAKVISSKSKANTPGELEMCWTQPVLPMVPEVPPETPLSVPPTNAP